MVLNHSVGPSSVETQAEVSQYIRIISLINNNNNDNGYF